MAMRKVLPLVIPPEGRQTASLIFCHGFGATAADWAMLSSEYVPTIQTNVKLILPQAPQRSITISRGAMQPAWFDILKMANEGRDQDGDEDEEGMRESLEQIDELVNAEVEAGIPRNRILVGGFSQGAALALLYGITRKKEETVAGALVLSGYAPLKWKLVETRKESSANELPIFWAHGSDDGVIPLSTAQDSHQLLEKSGMSSIEFHKYRGMQHEANLQEFRDLEKWLQKNLPDAQTAGKL